MNDSLTVEEAYRAMLTFLDRYYERGGCRSQDIAELLSGMSQTIWADGTTNDPAQWQDWLEAVRTVKDGEDSAP
jgi:hypothetical protein